MRTLLLLRGTMGAGKSTFIEQHNLQPFTLSADQIRLLASNPCLTKDGSFTITQQNDKMVWDLLMEFLEKRMQKGQFTVIDATHHSSHLTKRYKELAEQYKYSIFYYQFDTPLEQCLKNNASRDKYKFVPEDAIRRAHEIISTTDLPSYAKRIYDLNEIINFRTVKIDSEQYREVKVVGDLQGCFSVLNKNIQFNDNTFYVFVGDYVDRGLENKETLDFVHANMNKPNFVFVEGNHERHLNNYVLGDVEAVRSKEFAEKTLFEIYSKLVKEAKATLVDNEGKVVELQNLKTMFEQKYVNQHGREVFVISNKMKEQVKKQMREVYRKLNQCFAFEYTDKKYLVTHGGLTSVPQLSLISTLEMVGGVGGYEFDCSEVYKENFLAGNCQDFIQIHGHRAIDSNEYSICLVEELGVEFGGNLLVASIRAEHQQQSPINNIVIEKYKNDILFSVKEDKSSDKDKVLSKSECKSTLVREDFNGTDAEFKAVNDILRSDLTNVKLITTDFVDGNKVDLISVNFKEKAFYKKQWNAESIKARGLFLYKNGEVAMRSYNKFFNMYELPITSKPSLSKNLVFPVKAYKKENGFLGIMSVIKDEKGNYHLQLASKRTVAGEYKDYFQEIWDRESEEFKQQIFELSKNNNCSFVFEVVHHKDPHIIEYIGDQLYLLDAIKNTLTEKVSVFKHCSSLDHEFSNEICSQINFKKAQCTQYKELVETLYDVDELWQFIDEQRKVVTHEGFVFEDKLGFLFKVKCDFYTKWKSMRGLMAVFVASYQKGNDKSFPMQKCRTQEEVEFVNFLKQYCKQDENNFEKLKNDVSNIIKFRKLFWLHKNS